MGVFYCTREDVKSALDVKETARSNSQIDRACGAAVEAVHGLLRRKFYPVQDTRYFDWPDQKYRTPWRLWLNEDEVISVDTITSGGVVITDYFLEPANQGPPFTRVETDLDSNDSFGQGSDIQRNVAITGLFGHSANSASAGTIEEALDATETQVDVSDSQAIGIGDIIKVDSERMIVTEKSWLDSTDDTGSALIAKNNDDLVAVTSGANFTVGETILVDSEKMLITDIAGNSLIVIRAYDGSALAAHDSGTSIFVPRTLTVERAALGTTAAIHTDGTVITKHVYPALVRELATAEALNYFEQEKSGYARAAGTGESEREVGGRGLADIRKAAKRAHGRNMRMGSL